MKVWNIYFSNLSFLTYLCWLIRSVFFSHIVSLAILYFYNLCILIGDVQTICFNATIYMIIFVLTIIFRFFLYVPCYIYCLLYDSVSSLFHFVTSFVLLVMIYFKILSGCPRVDHLCLYQNMTIGNICTYGAKDLQILYML